MLQNNKQSIKLILGLECNVILFAYAQHSLHKTHSLYLSS